MTPGQYLLLRNFIFPFFLALSMPTPAYSQDKKWTLKECIDFAFVNAVSLNQQRLATDVSYINYKQARDNRLPVVNFTDGQAFSFGNTIYSSSNQVVRQNTLSNDPSLAASIVLFNGFKLINLVKENQLNYEAGKYDIETQKNYLALNITAAYMQVLFQDENVNIAALQIKQDSVLVDKIEKYVAVGLTPEDSLLQIKAELSAARAAKVSAENQLVLANVQLQQLMDMPVDAGFVIQQPIQIEMAPGNAATTSQDIYKNAESTFPEVKSASLRTSAYQTDLLVSKAALLPTLSLSGSLSTEYYSALKRENYQTTYQNQQIGFLQSNPSEVVVGPVPVTTTNAARYPFFSQFSDNFSQLVVLNLTVPIFNGYKARNGIQLAKIAVQNAKLNEQAVKNGLRKSIETAYTDMVTSSRNYIATKEQVAADYRAYTDMLKKYKIGLTNITDLLIAESNYYKVVVTNLQAKYEYMFKAKVIDFYTGVPLTN